MFILGGVLEYCESEEKKKSKAEKESVKGSQEPHTDEHVLDEHVSDEHVLDEYVTDEHVRISMLLMSTLG